MSARKLTLWDEFLAKFEQEAELDPAECQASKLTPDARAQRAGTLIKNRYGRDHFLDSVREALKGASTEFPEQTTRLSELCWPLVVSTNYDDLFFYSCRCNPNSPHIASATNVQVLGRSARDCKLVMSSLSGPLDRQYVWHIQGFLGGQYGENVQQDVENLTSLQDQMVIGHSEYRAVTNRDPEFRRCFGEIFNTRSFLFLGTSLKEDYFLNLFGEALDLCGPSAVPHFAFTMKGEVDAKFLSDQMNITVCEFDDWKTLPKWLERLRKEIAEPQTYTTRRSFVMRGGDPNSPDLEIVRGPVSLEVGGDEAVAFVAQRDSETKLPKLPEAFRDLSTAGGKSLGRHVFQFKDPRFYAVTARPEDSDDEDNGVYMACRQMLDLLPEAPAISNIHLQMSEFGGSVPPVFGFMEAVRTFAQWKREGSSKLRLTVHVEPTIQFNLDSGRIDIRELISSDQIRFWAVVCSGPNREPVRRALRYSPGVQLERVLHDIDLPCGGGSENWTVSLYPSPRRNDKPRTAADLLGCDLVQIGVAFGSVVILEYAEGARADESAAARAQAGGAKVQSAAAT